MEVQEKYQALRNQAIVCECCHDSPAIRRIELRPLKYKHDPNMTRSCKEICGACAIIWTSSIAICGYVWVDAGVSSSEFAASESGKAQLLNYIERHVRDQAFDDAVSSLRSMFRRKDFPASVRRIVSEVERNMSVARMFSRKRSGRNTKDSGSWFMRLFKRKRREVIA